MKKLILLMALVTTAVAGCGGSDSPDNGIRDLTGFVKKQVARTSERSAPIEINDVYFVDRDQEDPNAYDSVLNDM